MTLKTWKAEFLPVSARSCKKQDATAHSLLKWSGLRPAALHEHAMYADHDSICEDAAYAKRMRIDSGTCALCVWYYDRSCETCPGYKANRYTCNSAYVEFLNTGKPTKMIRWLKKIK